MSEAPNVGDRVEYTGTRLRLPEGLIEDPKRIGRTGIVVHGHDGDGNEIQSIPGQWPVHVKWDNDDPQQTCFKDEVKKLEDESA